jgi:hypothetical protein
VQRARWQDWLDAITATEMGVIRGVSVALSDPKKPAKLPPLPTWEEMQKRARKLMEETGPARPAWFDKYEEANRERMPWLRR